MFLHKLEVNAGPVEICRIFLANASKYPSDQIEQLRQCFRELLKASEDATQLNKTLIGPDQSEFQAELEIGMKNLKVFVEPYL
jgi:hypothetical protein